MMRGAAPASGRTVMIGDSMFAGAGEEGNGGSKVQENLEQLSGKSIENYSIVGSSLHQGWTKDIPAEYAALDKTVIPTTIIMDGGGNDVFSKRSDCEAFNDACKTQIDEAVALGANLLADMHKDGVKHVLWMGFFYISGLAAAVDYGAEKVAEVCASAAVDCHVADLRDLNIPRGWDGIHPDDTGYKMLADRIWEVKVANNIPV